MALKLTFVFSQMQEMVRQTGVHPRTLPYANLTPLSVLDPSQMDPSQRQKFEELFSSGRLVKPEDCGHVIAALALKAPKSLSGSFVTWDAPELAEYRS